MYYFTSSLRTYNIEARDGEMGKIRDLYMDDVAWKIRYAIVDTRKWLPERKVLLPPSAFIGINENKETMEVEYDKNTIKNSPPVPEDTVLTRDQENQLIKYFGWTSYRQDEVLVSGEQRSLGLFHSDSDRAGRNDNPTDHLPDEEMLMKHRDNNLRSQEELMNARAHAKDGKLGKVVDFIFDEHWNVKFIVLTSTDLTKKDFYCYPIEAIQSVDWYEGDVYLDDTVDNLQNKTIFKQKEDIIANIEAENRTEPL